MLTTLYLIVVAAQLIARLGTSQVSFTAMVLTITINGITSGMFLIAARLWLRGKWMLALGLMVAAFWAGPFLVSVSGGAMRNWTIPSQQPVR